MELVYLHNILNDLQSRFDAKYSPSPFKLKRELFLADHMEKVLIKKKVLDFDYNVGALQVLKILKETNILTLTDYLIHKENEAEVERIIADVLDCEDEQDLLAEVIIGSTSSELINSQFQECFRQFSSDVIDRPELIRNDFITGIEPQLPPDVYRDSIVLRFINELLAHEQENIVERNQVFAKQKDWNEQFGGEKLKLLTRILRHVALNHSEAIVKLLITNCVSNSSFNWFFFLVILGSINQKAKALDELKKYLKSLFQKFQDTKNVDHLFEMMIIARQLFHYTPDTDTTYKSWVKATIGEMSYQLNSQAKFIETLESLQTLIFFETDLVVLEIHAQTSIVPPRGTNHLVLEYKHLLKTRMASADPDNVMDLT